MPASTTLSMAPDRQNVATRTRRIWGGGAERQAIRLVAGAVMVVGIGLLSAEGAAGDASSALAAVAVSAPTTSAPALFDVIAAREGEADAEPPPALAEEVEHSREMDAQEEQVFVPVNPVTSAEAPRPPTSAVEADQSARELAASRQAASPEGISGSTAAEPADAVQVASLSLDPSSGTPPGPAEAPDAPAPTAPAPPAAPVRAAAPPVALNERSAGLFAAMNAERLLHGLPALELSPELSSVAQVRSDDMVSQGYFAHVSPTGSSWISVLQASGLRVQGGGENLARVGGDPARSVSVAITHLMDSPTHRANILHSDFARVGVAAVTDEQGVTVFTTVFATP